MTVRDRNTAAVPTRAVRRRHTHRARRQGRCRTIVLLLTAVVVIGSGAAWALQSLPGSLNAVDIDAALGADRPPRTTAANILLLGVDERDDDPELGSRSDTTVLVHLPASRSERSTAISIPRDLKVRRPPCVSDIEDGEQTVQFNAAYSQGGLSCAVQATEQLTGLRVDHTASLTFAGFARLVDAIGGVPITLDEPVDDPLSGAHLPSGDLVLDGAQALALVRSRHATADGSDLSRIVVQQRFLAAAVAKTSSMGLTDITNLGSLVDIVASTLQLDSSLASPAAVLDLAADVRLGIDTGIDFLTVPWTPDPYDLDRVIPLEPDATQLWHSLR
jgi:LCP family protein required for cell wall assembly